MNLLAATFRFLTGDIRALDVAVNDANGNQLNGFDPSRPATATRTTLAATTTSQTLLAANAARRRYIARNKSGATAYLSYSGAASAGSHDVVIPKNGYYEGTLNDYTGAITAVLSGGTGDIDVLEITT